MKQYLSEETAALIDDKTHAFSKIRDDLETLYPSVYKKGMDYHRPVVCSLSTMVNTWIHFTMDENDNKALQHICRFYNLDPLAVKAGAQELSDRSEEAKIWMVNWGGDVDLEDMVQEKPIKTKHINIQTGEPQGDVSSGLDATLQERGQTHGDFTDHARISQEFKATVAHELDLRSERGQEPLDATARESIDMILHKIARVIAGEWDEKDHWQDIAGYATITEKRIEK